MSLSITINNINDLTDAERAVLRHVLDGASMSDELRERRSLAIPQIIEGLAGDTDLNTSSGHAFDVTPPLPTPASATVGTSAELDTNGLPWDKRIHSSSRAKVADGRWRYARNIHPALITEVEAELRAVQAIPVPVSQTHGSPALDADAAKLEAMVGAGAAGPTLADVGVTPVPVPPVPPAPTITLVEIPTEPDLVNAPLTEAPSTSVIPTRPMSPDITDVVTPPAPAAPLTFADLMKHVTPMLVAGKLPQDKLLAITAEFGLPHLAALGARPDLVEAVRSRITEVCNG